MKLSLQTFFLAMQLAREIERFRLVKILSPYSSLNIALALSLARYWLEKGARVAISSSIPLSICSEAVTKLLSKGLRLEPIDNIDRAIVIYSDSVEDIPRARGVILIGSRSPRLRVDASYRARQVEPNTYSLVGDEGIHLLKVRNCFVEELEIPEEVKMIYNEVRDIYMEFGAVKAWTVVKMLMKRYGLSREQAIDVVRRAIAVGLLKYESGYLIPAM